MINMVDGALNPRIQVFDTDGNFVTSIGTKGNGDDELSKPEHIKYWLIRKRVRSK